MKRILLLLLIVVPLWQSCDFFKKKDMFSGDADTAELYQKKQDSLEFVDSIKKLQNKIARLRMEHQRLQDSLQATGQPKKAAGSDYEYHVIVGSFKTQEYLNSYKRYVEERGFDTRILQNRYGFNLVSVESTDNWNKAVTTLEALRKDFEESAWIYRGQ
jgi:cell division protein FtsN